MKRKASTLSSHETDANQAESSVPAASEVEDIDEDDLCPICHLLLYRPVRTRCNHTLCEACMAHWADVSITSQMTTVGLDDQAVVLLPHEIETRCPMCRTSTTATFDPSRESALQRQYPKASHAREIESRTADADDFASSIETLTVYIGNEHRLIRAYDESNNRHDWKFFVRPSRTDLIEEVQIFLVSMLLLFSSVYLTWPTHFSAPDIPQSASHSSISSIRDTSSRLGLFYHCCQRYTQGWV